MFFNKKIMDQSLIPEKKRELPKIEQQNQINKKEALNKKLKIKNNCNQNSNEVVQIKCDYINRSI